MTWKRLYVHLDEHDQVRAAGCEWFPEGIYASVPTMRFTVPDKDLRWSTQYLVSLLLDIAHDGPGDYYETHTDGVLPFPSTGGLDVEGY